MKNHNRPRRIPRALLLPLALLVASSARLAASQPDSVSCYGVDGVLHPKQVRCPGSLACCGEHESCMPNRLCRQPGLEKDVFIRGACAVSPYDVEKCAQICATYDETEHGGGFPRVDRCDDGSYCCRDIADCCARGKGVFLDGDGNIIDKEDERGIATSASTLQRARADGDYTEGDYTEGDYSEGDFSEGDYTEDNAPVDPPKPSPKPSTSTSTTTSRSPSPSPKSSPSPQETNPPSDISPSQGDTRPEPTDGSSGGSNSEGNDDNDDDDDDSNGSSGNSSSGSKTNTNDDGSGDDNNSEGESKASGQDSALAFKVGLGLGIPLAAIVAAAAVWFLLSRRMRRPRSEGPGSEAWAGAGGGVTMKPDPYAYRYPSEVDGRALIGEDPVELPGGGDGHKTEASKV